jgi:glycosyltransferase involved in cell wall biosynthesis
VTCFSGQNDFSESKIRGDLVFRVIRMHPVNRLQNFQRSSKDRKPAILLTSYGTGADQGQNLGVPGYSHDIVMRLYAPLLEEWGEVIPVGNPHEYLEEAITDAQRRGLDPIHLSVIPCQDAYLSPNIANVLMPAWEFPDIPDHEFGDNPQNNWIQVVEQCAALVVSGPFTEKAFRKSGAKLPIHFVQVPTPESYFEVGDWSYGQTATIDCSGYHFPEVEEEQPVICLPLRRKKPDRGLKRVGKKLESAVRTAARKTIGEGQYRKISNRVSRANRRYALPQPNLEQLDLSGVVYTSIFNPNDGRKNWQDLLTSFLVALGDKEDATLVVKLITKDPVGVARFLRYYQSRNVSHRCQLVVVSQYLTEEQLVDLAAASTYYIQTTRAEGNCLPLMNALAAGRPGISPCHSAISDYFDDEIGFVAESHPEPAAWPHDPLLSMRSTWGRLVWTSMVEKIRESYRIAKYEPNTYQQISRRARTRLRSWAGTENVKARLLAALDEIRSRNTGDSENPDSSKPMSEPLVPQRAA